MTDDVTSERWAEKTDSLIGIDLDAPAPVMRYQLLQGSLYTLQMFPDGSTARGMLEPSEFEQFTGRPLGDDGWYDPRGEFLGESPGIEGF